jgi:hypothetical protein
VPRVERLLQRWLVLLAICCAWDVKNLFGILRHAERNGNGGARFKIVANHPTSPWLRWLNPHLTGM